jgi:hypothetical protein
MCSVFTCDHNNFQIMRYWCVQCYSCPIGLIVVWFYQRVKRVHCVRWLFHFHQWIAIALHIILDTGVICVDACCLAPVRWWLGSVHPIQVGQVSQPLVFVVCQESISGSQSCCPIALSTHRLSKMFVAWVGSLEKQWRGATPLLQISNLLWPVLRILMAQQPKAEYHKPSRERQINDNTWLQRSQSDVSCPQQQHHMAKLNLCPNRDGDSSLATFGSWCINLYGVDLTDMEPFSGDVVCDIRGNCYMSALCCMQSIRFQWWIAMIRQTSSYHSLK